MGPGGFAARQLWALLCRSHRPVAGAASRLRSLAAGQLPAGPALSRTCPTRHRARGLHGGPGLEEPTCGAVGEGRVESRPAGHTGPKFDIDMLVSLLRQENARDICVIKVPPEMKYADYFVIASGTSTRHLHAVVHYVVKTYKFLKCKSEPHVKIEGKDTEDWMCVDFGKLFRHIQTRMTANRMRAEAETGEGPFVVAEGLVFVTLGLNNPAKVKLKSIPGSMVIHLMLPETREKYELEKLWTLRSYDDQLAQIAPETLPEDFILGLEDDTASLTAVEFK